MTRKRIPYKKYPIEDTIEFCRNTPDWREYAREKHDKVFTDLVNGLSIKEVCEKYSIKKGNIYDYSASLRHRYDNKITGKKKVAEESERVVKIRKYFEAVNEERKNDIDE